MKSLGKGCKPVVLWWGRHLDCGCDFGSPRRGGAGAGNMFCFALVSLSHFLSFLFLISVISVYFEGSRCATKALRFKGYYNVTG